jgi:hypothetical protein
MTDIVSGLPLEFGLGLPNSVGWNLASPNVADHTWDSPEIPLNSTINRAPKQILTVLSGAAFGPSDHRTLGLWVEPVPGSINQKGFKIRMRRPQEQGGGVISRITVSWIAIY